MGNSSSQASTTDINQNAIPTADANLGGKGMSKEEIQRLAVSALAEVPSECPMHGQSQPSSGCPVQHGGQNKENVDPANMVRYIWTSTLDHSHTLWCGTQLLWATKLTGGNTNHVLTKLIHLRLQHH